MRQKDEHKQIQIIEAALRLIQENGLAGLNMSTLAKKAGIATGTVYIYFKDKESLVAELYKTILKESTAVNLIENASDGSVKQKIQSIAYNYVVAHLKHPEWAAFLEQFYRSPYFQAAGQGIHMENPTLRPILNVIKEGQKQDLIKDIDPSLLVSLSCGLLDALVLNIEVKEDIQDKFELAFPILWDAIKS